MNIGIVTDQLLTSNQARAYAQELDYMKTVGSQHAYHKGFRVGKTDRLVAAPDSEKDNGSKTWNTIRTARTMGARVSIVYPSGAVMQIR